MEPLRVDIISDVVCPWCIIGYLQLVQGAEQAGIPIETYWHPFELNPDMAPEGENLGDHITRKYGSTPEQSRAARARLQELGESLGFEFSFSPDSRIVNTFEAHQLLHWASDLGRTHDLKQAFFTAYFTEGRDVSDRETLLAIVGETGMDTAAARAALQQGELGQTVRQKEAFWTSRGVSSVPTMIFDARFATSGAQGADTFAEVLTKVASTRGAA